MLKARTIILHRLKGRLRTPRLNGEGGGFTDLFAKLLGDLGGFVIEFAIWGGVVIKIRIPCILHVSCMYFACILM